MMWLKFYLIGCLVAFLICICTMRDKDRKINWMDISISTFISLASWSTVFGLLIGFLIMWGDNKLDNK